MKYYVVWVGRKPGIYTEWEECKEQVHKFKGARYKSFHSKVYAEEAYRGKPEDYSYYAKKSVIPKKVNRTREPLPKVNFPKFPRNT